MGIFPDPVRERNHRGNIYRVMRAVYDPAYEKTEDREKQRQDMIRKMRTDPKNCLLTDRIHGKKQRMPFYVINRKGDMYETDTLFDPGADHHDVFNL